MKIQLRVQRGEQKLTSPPGGKKGNDNVTIFFQKATGIQCRGLLFILKLFLFDVKCPFFSKDANKSWPFKKKYTYLVKYVENPILIPKIFFFLVFFTDTWDLKVQVALC